MTVISMGKDLNYIFDECSAMRAKMLDIANELTAINRMLISLNTHDQYTTQVLDRVSTRLGECSFRLKKQ